MQKQCSNIQKEKEKEKEKVEHRCVRNFEKLFLFKKNYRKFFKYYQKVDKFWKSQNQ